MWLGWPVCFFAFCDVTSAFGWHISRCLSNRTLYQTVQNMEGKVPLTLFIVMRFEHNQYTAQQKSSNYSYYPKTEVRKKIQSESKRISKVWIIQEALQKYYENGSMVMLMFKSLKTCYFSSGSTTPPQKYYHQHSDHHKSSTAKKASITKLKSVDPRILILVISSDSSQILRVQRCLPSSEVLTNKAKRNSSFSVQSTRLHI